MTWFDIVKKYEEKSAAVPFYSAIIIAQSGIGKNAMREEHLKRRVEWRKQQEIINKEFEVEIMKEFGLENHPKKKQIYEYAYREWHSGGFSEVAIGLSELSELFK